VHDVIDERYVEAARRDVGGDQHAVLGSAEAVEILLRVRTSATCTVHRDVPSSERAAASAHANPTQALSTHTHTHSHSHSLVTMCILTHALADLSTAAGGAAVGVCSVSS
jgi:hypothetical protein